MDSGWLIERDLGGGSSLAWERLQGWGPRTSPQGGHSLRPVSQEGVCRRVLLGPAFAPCHGLVDAEVYVAACTQDLCRCPSCPCATFAEYSRQCAHAGGQPQNWRGPDLCRECPGEGGGR